MEVKSLDTNDTDLPPPIPPKNFLEEELFPTPESGEPHRNITPPLPHKTNQEGSAQPLTSHPSNVHQPL